MCRSVILRDALDMNMIDAHPIQQPGPVAPTESRDKVIRSVTGEALPVE